jgi:hypothetical protein
MEDIRSEELAEFGRAAGLSVSPEELNEFAAASDSPMLNMLCLAGCPD